MAESPRGEPYLVVTPSGGQRECRCGSCIWVQLTYPMVAWIECAGCGGSFDSGKWKYDGND